MTVSSQKKSEYSKLLISTQWHLLSLHTSKACNFFHSQDVQCKANWAGSKNNALSFIFAYDMAPNFDICQSKRSKCKRALRPGRVLFWSRLKNLLSFTEKPGQQQNRLPQKVQLFYMVLVMQWMCKTKPPTRCLFRISLSENSTGMFVCLFFYKNWYFP